MNHRPQPAIGNRSPFTLLPTANRRRVALPANPQSAIQNAGVDDRGDARAAGRQTFGLGPETGGREVRQVGLSQRALVNANRLSLKGIPPPSQWMLRPRCATTKSPATSGTRICDQLQCLC